MKSKALKVVQWIFAAFLLLMAIASASRGFFGAFLVLVGAFVISPLFDKIPKIGTRIGLRFLLCMILFIVGIGIQPNDSVEDQEEVPAREIIEEDTVATDETTTDIETSTVAEAEETTTTSTETATTTTIPVTTQAVVIQTEAPTTAPPAPTQAERRVVHFILNTSTNCVHIRSTCSAAEAIAPENYQEIDIYEDDLGTYEGVYWACGKCSQSYRNVLPAFDD